VFNVTRPYLIIALSLHDALPISSGRVARGDPGYQRPFLSEGSSRNNELASSARTRLAGRNTCSRAKSLSAKTRHPYGSDRCHCLEVRGHLPSGRSRILWLLLLGATCYQVAYRPW